MILVLVNKPMKLLTSILIGTTLILLIISAIIGVNIIQETETIKEYIVNYQTSFEEENNTWTPTGVDLNDPPINWSINTTNEKAIHENNSLKFYLENNNDAGKIWVQQGFNLKKNTTYLVEISYQFCTKDFGELNLFSIITGADISAPTSRDQLTFQDDTGHHQDTQDWVWLEKNYTFYPTTDQNGSIYVSIGIWGSWETTRTYYIDNLSITFTQLNISAEIPDISGNWTLSHYDWQGNLTKTENISIEVDEEKQVTIKYEEGFFDTGKIVPNAINNTEIETQYLIVDCDVRGLGVDIIYIINATSMKTELPACESCNPSVFSR